jgi:hypothetical protein
VAKIFGYFASLQSYKEIDQEKGTREIDYINKTAQGRTLRRLYFSQTINEQAP